MKITGRLNYLKKKSGRWKSYVEVDQKVGLKNMKTKNYQTIKSLITPFINL